MKYRGKLKNLKMEEQFWMKQEPLILSSGEFLFWRNTSNNSFRVLGMPSDLIGGDNLILLHFCLLMIMFTSMLSSMGETYSWSWGFFYNSLCATSSSDWVKMTALLHTRFPDLHEQGLCFIFLLGIQWCTTSHISSVLFYFRCTVPMRDKEGKQDYRYFFFK